MTTIEALLVIVPALIALVAGVLVALVQARRNLETQYDIDLRKERIGVYQKLWAAFEALAFYSPPGPVTLQTVRSVSTAMREWYYKDGGLFLSTEARDVYFRLQRELTKTAHSRGVGTNDELDFDRREHIKALTSRLRTQMTEDVKTRVGSRLGGSLHARIKQGSQAPSDSVTVTVRQGVPWDPAEAESYVVTVQNHSWQREVVLEKASIEGAPQIGVSNDYRPLPVELPAQENWIGRVLISHVDSALGKQTPCVITILAGGEQASGCA
ncbi:MAG TPA: hypothetical protein VD769_00110 [Gaiellaceae bacterium]|nr:hypothetical protein [Gaiellaceae bacterium]